MAFLETALRYTLKINMEPENHSLKWKLIFQTSSLGFKTLILLGVILVCWYFRVEKWDSYV